MMREKEELSKLRVGGVIDKAPRLESWSIPGSVLVAWDTRGKLGSRVGGVCTRLQCLWTQ